jgi:hypothetical protein
VVKLVAIAGAGLCALVVAAGGSLVMLTVAVLGGPRGQAPAAGTDIPAELQPVYRAAAASCPLPWEVLAAVGKVESDHGRSQRPGVRSGANAAGAMGPMQFLAATWAAYGVDADGDGVADPYGAVDSIWGAARYLCANGAGDPARLRSALWNYNHDDAYVEHVLAVAARYRGDPPAGVDARSLVDHPNLVLTPWARADLLAGRIDQRVVDFLAWAASRHTISVSVLATGHARFVRDSNRVSTHWVGRGVDIYAVDGQRVAPGSPVARAFSVEVIDLAPELRPDEIGVPWADLGRHVGVFADEDHLDHLHFGFDDSERRLAAA